MSVTSGRSREELLDRLTSIPRFCHEGHARRLRGEQPGDTLPHDGVIVDTEDPDALGIVAHEPPVSLGPKTF